MKHALRRPLVPLATTLALALSMSLSLSACSQDEPAAFEETATQPSAAAEPAAEDDVNDEAEATEDAGTTPAPATTDAPDDVTAQSAAAAGVDLNSLGEPIATVSVPAQVEGDPDATMDVSLYSLTRDGETVIGAYSFHVRSDTGSDDARWVYDYLGGQAWHPHLVDTQNLTRHDVLRQGATFAMTDYQGVKFRPGQTLFAYAAFAAPPADVTTMTVSLLDGAQPVSEVPVR